MIPFEMGASYSRREMHRITGGQVQTGISTPKGEPFILLFTGQRGRRFGCSDGWTDEGTFRYTGEGMRGDMAFVRGNRAIRDYLEDGRSLLLFETLPNKKRRFIGRWP